MTPESLHGENSIQAGPPKPRDEAAIRRRIYAAVTAADDLLRDLWIRENDPEGFAHIDFKTQISRVRGLLAEWRLERE